MSQYNSDWKVSWDTTNPSEWRIDPVITFSSDMEIKMLRAELDKARLKIEQLEVEVKYYKTKESTFLYKIGSLLTEFREPQKMQTFFNATVAPTNYTRNIK